jgi:hypothetical protein
VIGAGGENRTLTGLPQPDFESGASACSTTPALLILKDFRSPVKFGQIAL